MRFFGVGKATIGKCQYSKHQQHYGRDLNTIHKIPLLIIHSTRVNTRYLYANVQSAGFNRITVSMKIRGVFDMSLTMILLIVLVLILLGVVPTWPHSRSWGYAPGGTVGVILVVVLILVLAGKI